MSFSAHAADEHGRSAKAAVTSVEPVIFSLKISFEQVLNLCPKLLLNSAQRAEYSLPSMAIARRR